MLLTYYMWIKAVKTGSIYWAAMCALAYFYMVSVPFHGTEVFLTLGGLLLVWGLKVCSMQFLRLRIQGTRPLYGT